MSSGSDFTLGDFWGMANVLPELDDDKGYSILVHNNAKKSIENLFRNVGFREIRYEDVLRYNPSLEISVDSPRYRALFFKYLNKGECIPAIHRILKKGRWIRRLKRVLKKIRMYK